MSLASLSSGYTLVSPTPHGFLKQQALKDERFLVLDRGIDLLALFASGKVRRT